VAPQDWNSPVLAGGPKAMTPAPAAAFEMRPLSTGEVLDRTFAVYRSRFWLFAGLAAISGGFQVIVNGLQLLVHHLLLAHYGFQAAKVESQISSPFLLLLLLPVTAVIYAASVFALCEVYLGRAITAGEALHSVAQQWMRYLGIALWWGWSAGWAFALLAIPAFIIVLVLKPKPLLWLAGLLFFLAFTGGFVYGAIAYIRNALAIPAAVMEGCGVRASMRRSKTLAAGSKGRIFVVMLIAFALYMVALTVDAPMLFMIGRAPFQEHIAAQAVILLVGFVCNTLVSPVALIGLSLVYFDQRVRKEGFDLLMLLGSETTSAVTTGSPQASPNVAPFGSAVAPFGAYPANSSPAESGYAAPSHPATTTGETIASFEDNASEF
jgi:hypothetical protein